MTQHTCWPPGDAAAEAATPPAKPKPKTEHSKRCRCGGEYRRGRLRTASGYVPALRCEKCSEIYLSATALIELVLNPFDEDER